MKMEKRCGILYHFSKKVKYLFPDKEWFHEILSFIILLCDHSDLSEGRTTIYKNKNGFYCADLGNGELRFDSASTLYLAFIWFHLHIEEYCEEFNRAYERNHLMIGDSHIYTANSLYLRKTALQEMPKECMRKYRFSLSPVKFYLMLIRARSSYRPNLYILDLDTDVNNHKKDIEN